MSNKLRSEIIQKLINNKNTMLLIIQDYFIKEIVITEYCCMISVCLKDDVVHVLLKKCQ